MIYIEWLESYNLYFIMKKVLLIVAMFTSLALYGQKKPDYRIATIPGAQFFHALYKDDFIGDTLLVDGKMYFFSQSPMKQSSKYMMDEEDYRSPMPGFGQTKGITWGMPDKGYVLHFSTSKDKMIQVNRATYNGTIYEEEQGKPMEAILLLNAMGEMNRLMEDIKGYPTCPFVLPWLNGRYRLNDMQVNPGYSYKGKRYIAGFDNGKLIEILPDTEKENFNPPLVDMSERPEGMSMHDYIPEYVYYKLPNGERQKEKLDVATKKWQQKVMDTFQTEPFLDLDCIEALRRIWIKK